MFSTKLIFATLAFAPAVFSHSWVQQLRNINSTGDYVGDYGYPRGMIATTDPGYNGDTSMNWQLPQNSYGTPWINDSMPLCHPSQRSASSTSTKYPRLKASPGNFMALRYLENGHTTLTKNQPGKMAGSGTVFVYGTTTPDDSEKIGTVLDWTEDGSGGDKRGVLLATNNFDDGRCYQVNPSAESLQRAVANPNFALGQVGDGPGRFELPCETDVQMPKDAKSGQPYTLYWVWQWNTQPGIDPGLPKGKDEYYTTCIDVDVVDGSSAKSLAVAPAVHAIAQQDAMEEAVKGFSTRSAFYTVPVKGEFGPIFSSSGAPSQTGATGAGPALTSKTTLATAAKPTDIPALTHHAGQGAAPQASPAPDHMVVTDIVTVVVTATVDVPAAATPHARRHARRWDARHQR